MSLSGPGQAPQWFRDAVARRPDRGEVVVGGTSVAYRVWGQLGLPVLALVHGGSAHSGWWDHVAPLLSERYRVVAPDLSGHGDSGRRERYDIASWATEVVGVTDAERVAGSDRPLVVGHSLGGWVTLTVAAQYPDRVRAIAIIDAPVRQRSPEDRAAAEHRAFGPLKVYPTAAEAISRFRLVPDQGQQVLDYVVAHVAAASVRETAGGWTWKFDPAIFGRVTETRPALDQVRCPVAVLRSRHGLLTAENSAMIAGSVGGPAIEVELPAAGHHAMMDEPLSLIAALRTLLAAWDRPAAPGAPADA